MTSLITYWEHNSHDRSAHNFFRNKHQCRQKPNLRGERQNIGGFQWEENIKFPKTTVSDTDFLSSWAKEINKKKAFLHAASALVLMWPQENRTCTKDPDPAESLQPLGCRTLARK